MTTIPTISIEDVSRDHDYVPRPKPITKLNWVTATGAWGDTIAAIGNAVHMVGGEFGVIYFGQDPNIPKWLRKQWFIKEVVEFIEPDRWKYLCTLSDISRDVMEHDPLRTIWGMLYDLDPFIDTRIINLYATHTELASARRWEPHRWHGSVTGLWGEGDPREDYGWGGTSTILFQPISLQSCDMAHHWPHWNDALRVLLERTPFDYTVVGKGWELAGDHRRVHNLVNKLDTMEQMFAIARNCNGVITTPNALSLFCAMENIPALVCANEGVSHPWDYFRKWIDTPSTTWVEFNEDVCTFLPKAARYLGLT